MSWAAGTFTRTNGVHTGAQAWAEDQAAGTKILESRHDTHDYDLANGINACINKAGGNVPTANLPMGGFKHTGVANGSSSTDYVTLDQTKHIIGNFPGRTLLDGTYAITTTQTPVRWRVPKAAKATHIVAQVSLDPDTITGGTLTITLYKNGATTGEALVLGAVTGGVATIATPVSFAAGDLIGLATTQAATTYTGGGTDINFQVWGYFT